MEKNLNNRLFVFAVLIIRILRKLPESSEFRFLKNQLARAATSAGANYEEAQGGSSYRDFTYKAEIALREMREANYWLRLMKESGDYPTQYLGKIGELIEESNQLKKILGSIVSKAKKKIKDNK